MLVEKLPSQCRHGDHDSESVLMVALDEAAFIGLLPYRKTRT